MCDEEVVHESTEGEEEGDGEESLADERQVELAPLGPRQVDLTVALNVDVGHDPEDEGSREQRQHHQGVSDAQLMEQRGTRGDMQVY